MSGFQVVVFWLDVLIWLFVVVGVGLSVLIVKSLLLFVVWCWVGVSWVGMVLVIVLLVFILVGLFDLLYYWVQMKSEVGQKVIYVIEVFLVFDVFVVLLWICNEKIYFELFVICFYVKEIIDVLGGGMVCDYLCLKYGGVYFGECEVEVVIDVVVIVFWVGGVVLIGWLVLVGIVFIVVGVSGDGQGVVDGLGW